MPHFLVTYQSPFSIEVDSGDLLVTRAILIQEQQEHGMFLGWPELPETHDYFTDTIRLSHTKRILNVRLATKSRSLPSHLCGARGLVERVKCGCLRCDQRGAQVK